MNVEAIKMLIRCKLFFVSMLLMERLPKYAFAGFFCYIIYTFRFIIHGFLGLFGREEGVDLGVELLLEILVVDAGGGA